MAQTAKKRELERRKEADEEQELHRQMDGRRGGCVSSLTNTTSGVRQKSVGKRDDRTWPTDTILSSSTTQELLFLFRKIEDDGNESATRDKESKQHDHFPE